MGKIKSAIITSLVVIAILAASFFAVVSFPYGNGQLNRLNSIASSIRLGGEFTGYAETVIYPEGVISEAEYLINKETTDDADYANKFTKHGNLYVEKEVESGLAEKVAADAAVLNERLAKMSYSGYSVAIVNTYSIKISVAMAYTYADYAYSLYANDESPASNKLNNISSALSFVTLDGELSFRNSQGSSDYDIYETGVNSLFGINVDVTKFISNVYPYHAAGNHAVKVDLTEEGKAQFNKISNYVLGLDDNSKQILFYIGDEQLLPLGVSEAITENSFYISASTEEQAKFCAAILGSVAKGQTISTEYKSENSDSFRLMVVENTRGKAIIWGSVITALVLFIAISVYSVYKYKKLGVVQIMMMLMYALIMVYAIFLLNIELTLLGIVTIFLGLGLLTVANFVVFNKTQQYVKEGNVMRNAVREAYKNHFAGNTEVHFVLLVAGIMLALIAKGAVAACGFIFLIAVIASYVLYWFTRFMWYVLSSPVKNKFAFCGFKREVSDDED